MQLDPRSSTKNVGGQKWAHHKSNSTKPRFFLNSGDIVVYLLATSFRRKTYKRDKHLKFMNFGLSKPERRLAS